MPKFLIETSMLGYAMAIGVILVLVGTMIIGITCSTIQPLGDQMGVGSDTTPILTMIGINFGIFVIAAGILAPIIGYVISAFRQEPESYYREENQYYQR